MTKLELLAPAKDLQCGLAAINCGADAVYIGSPRFGARENAGNSLEDIAVLVKYAHKYWAKIYVTVNTLLRDEEIPPALDLISHLHETGVDGLIIQDTGLLECDLPPIPLIASTQMHNNTPERVAFLEKVGFQRAILARELDLSQIRNIRKATKIELECFIHGALCVCYSGQCYLSYALGGRSGNRGQCAQPCRKSYSLLDAEGNILVRDRHLLSLKDMNLSEHLRDLIDAGVSSFKIEGRLKDAGYVSNIVSYYRQKLDKVIEGTDLKKSSSGTSIFDFTPDPNKTFNRGYSTYFLLGKGEPIGSPDTPKMIGEPIGRIISLSKQGVEVDTDVDLHQGDGVSYFDRHRQLGGTTVHEVKGKTFFPDKRGGMERGTFLYRNHDHEFLTRLMKSRTERQMDVEFTLRETPDGFTLVALDEDGNTADFSFSCEKTRAEKPELALENIKKQLQKTGGTEFNCRNVSVELNEAYFLPISTLNTLRRSVLEKLVSVRLENHPVLKGGAIKNDVPYSEKILSYLGNVLNRKAEAFYRRHGVTRIEPAAESGLDMRGKKVMTTRYCLKHQFGNCPKDGNNPRNPEPLSLIDAEANRLELRFDCRECQMEIYLKR